MTSRLDKKVKKFVISRLSDFESTCSGFYAWFWWQVLFKLTRHVFGMGLVVSLQMTLNSEIVWIVTILDLLKCPKIRNITRNCTRRVHISGKKTPFNIRLKWVRIECKWVSGWRHWVQISVLRLDFKMSANWVS